MRDKPKTGMKPKQSKKKHDDAKEDMAMLKKKVKKGCMK